MIRCMDHVIYDPSGRGAPPKQDFAIGCSRSMTRPSLALATLSHVRLPTVHRANQLMAMPALDLIDRRRRWTAREVRELIAASPLATPRYEPPYQRTVPEYWIIDV